MAAFLLTPFDLCFFSWLLTGTEHWAQTMGPSFALLSDECFPWLRHKCLANSMKVTFE
jgi:hypothetical protein